MDRSRRPMMGGSGVARRGVLVLLGCAWILSLAGAARGSERTGGPVLLAQLRAPIVAQAPGAQQRPRLISLDFKDADINNILRILAEFSGLNIVTSDDVKGKVTVKLQNVPWQQALDSVVRAAKLAYVQEGNIIRVDKLENLTKEAEAAFRAEQREVEIQQRRKEADLRLADQERAAALAKQEFDVRRKALEDELVPLAEEVFKLRYGHVGIKRVEAPNFFNDEVTTHRGAGLRGGDHGRRQEGRGQAGRHALRARSADDRPAHQLDHRARYPRLSRQDPGVHRQDRPRRAVGPHRGPAGGDGADGRAIPRRDLGRRVDPPHRLEPARRRRARYRRRDGGPRLPRAPSGHRPPPTSRPRSLACSRGRTPSRWESAGWLRTSRSTSSSRRWRGSSGRGSSPPRAC